MIRTLLVDDEAAARGRLRRLLGDHPDVEVVGEADNGRRALERAGELRPDLVLLDIEMPELDGIGVAAELAQDGPAVIFVTAYDQHALEAFEVAAVDYVVKPVRKDRLAAALDRVRARHHPGPDAATLAQLATTLGRASTPARVALKSGSQHLFVDVERIAVVWARDHYSEVETTDGRDILCDDSLESMERKLTAGSFLRVHRSALVNTTCLASLDREGDRRYVAVMAGERATRVPIARDRLADVKAALGVA